MIADGQGLVSRSGLYSLASATCMNTAGTCTMDSTPVSAASMLQFATNAPLSAWDFTNVWREVAGAFPALR